MPLPREPFTIHGGCNCRAIRYRVSVPTFTERKMNPYHNPGVHIGDLRLPAIFMDHCNDCRRATSAVTPIALICDKAVAHVSVLPKSDHGEGAFDIADADREWKPASEVLDFDNLAGKDWYLNAYNSSPKRSRWFCSRCGTPFAYSVALGVVPPEWGWPPMVDFWLGTVDREDLEKDYMHPERMVYCEKGVPWALSLARHGSGGIPEHPLTRIDKLVGEEKKEVWSDKRDELEMRFWVR